MKEDSWEPVLCPEEGAAEKGHESKGFRGCLQPLFTFLGKFTFSLNHEPPPVCSWGLLGYSWDQFRA